MPALQNRKCSPGGSGQPAGLGGSGEAGSDSAAAPALWQRRLPQPEGLRPPPPAKPLCVTALAARWETLTEPCPPEMRCLVIPELPARKSSASSEVRAARGRTPRACPPTSPLSALSPRSPLAAGSAAGRPPQVGRGTVRRPGALFPRRHAPPRAGLAPGSPLRPPRAGAAAGGCCRGLLPELLPGLRPPPPLPARLRAAPAALLPVCAGGGGVSQWRESEPVLLQQHPCAAGTVRELCEATPSPGASTVPCRHSGPGPAAAREPLLSLQGRGHRDWEPKSFVCGFVSCLRAAQAEASTRSPWGSPLLPRETRRPPGHTRSPSIPLTPTHQPALSTRVPKVLPLLCKHCLRPAP